MFKLYLQVDVSAAAAAAAAAADQAESALCHWSAC